MPSFTPNIIFTLRPLRVPSPRMIFQYTKPSLFPISLLNRHVDVFQRDPKPHVREQFLFSSHPIHVFPSTNVSGRPQTRDGNEFRSLPEMKGAHVTNFIFGIRLSHDIL